MAMASNRTENERRHDSSNLASSCTFVVPRRDDVDAWTVIRQTHTHIDDLWAEFVSCPLVNDPSSDGQTVDEGSFSIDAETRYLTKAEEAVRNSLEQVQSSMYMPCSIENDSEYQCSFLVPMDSSHSTEWPSGCCDDVKALTRGRNNNHPVISSSSFSSYFMSRVSSLSTDWSASSLSVSNSDRPGHGKQGNLVHACHVVLCIADCLFGKHPYCVEFSFGCSRTTIIRSYQGTCCFFLAMLMICTNVFSESFCSSHSMKWFTILHLAVTLTMLQIHVPHKLDEVFLAFILVLPLVHEWW